MWLVDDVSSSSSMGNRIAGKMSAISKNKILTSAFAPFIGDEEEADKFVDDGLSRPRV